MGKLVVSAYFNTLKVKIINCYEISDFKNCTYFRHINKYPRIAVQSLVGIAY